MAASRSWQEMPMARRLFFALIALKKWPIPAPVRAHLKNLTLYYTIDALSQYQLRPGLPSCRLSYSVRSRQNGLRDFRPAHMKALGNSLSKGPCQTMMFRQCDR